MIYKVGATAYEFVRVALEAFEKFWYSNLPARRGARKRDITNCLLARIG